MSSHHAVVYSRGVGLDYTQFAGSLLPSSRKFAWLALSVAGILIALLLFVVEGNSAPATSLLLSNLLQTAIALWATYCSFRVVKRTSGYLRQLWLLFTAALFLVAAAQASETYYENFVHAPSLMPWPSDVLFILWATPALMMFLPRPAEKSGAIDWQQVLDFAQIGVVALTAYLYFYYVPSRWEVEGPQMVVNVMRVQVLRDLALAAGFAVRAVTLSPRHIRALFGRIAIFFLLSATSAIVFVFGARSSGLRATWTDILWCLPFLFATFFAATWNYEEESIPLATRSQFRVVVVSQVLPILIPLLVLLMGRRIAVEQITIAWVAMTASFILSATRLVLTSEKQRRIAHELRRTEEALRRSEQMFYTAFRSSPDAIGITSILEGRFLEVNDSFERLTGYTRGETLGKTPSAMNLWKDPSHRAKVISRLKEESEVREEEFQCLTKSGDIRICQFSGTLIDLDGQLCALVIVRDITARKKADEALRASEERFRNLVQDLHVGVVLLGPKAETNFANRAALKMFGLSEQQTHGKSTSSFDLIAIREDGTEIPFAMRTGPRAIATKKPIRNEVVGWRRPESNEVFWTLVDAVPHFTPDGEVASVILSISNVTEWKQAEQALRASEARFRTLVQDFHVGVVMLGPDATLQFANQAAQQLFGYTAEQAKGKRSSQLDLISIREDGTEVPFSMRPGVRAIATRQAILNAVIGWRRRDSNEILWTLGNAVPQFSSDGSVSAVVYTFTNITERKQAEEALHQLSTRLLQLQDEERRRLGRELHDSLAQSVLAVNLNLAQAAQSSDSLSERGKHSLAEARRLLQEMSREIRTLSYLLHPPLLDELGLVSAIREYAEGFSERSGVELELHLQSGFGRLPQEAETALFRIVQESLTNIQRHSGSKTATISLRGDSDCVNLDVSDHGRGMDKTSIERGNGSGNRLGVGILGMRERMMQLGGKLEIESSSSGTTIRVLIPLKAGVSNVGSNPCS
jgi:two-component system NarL family sensor kinase